MEKIRKYGMDMDQVSKAVRALLAYQRTKENVNKLLINEHNSMFLMVTVWKVPSRPQTIRIRLPHGVRPDACEVCLFTKDEPNMTSEQTEMLYRKMLSQHGITQITKVITLTKMKKEYKPYEAKRRLLGSFDLFLADARIRRLLPSHIGKHFYKEKSEPQSVNLKAKHLAFELNQFIQGTQLHITNKGCCYAIRLGHTGMKVEEIIENALAVAEVLAEKLPMKWQNVKVLHLKTQTSIALPIYNSPIGNLQKEDFTQTVDNNKLQPSKTPGKEVEAAGKFQEPGLMHSAKRRKINSDTKAKISRNKKGHTEKQAIENVESPESTSKPDVLIKTSKQSMVKLTKSSKKAPLTKKQKRN